MPYTPDATDVAQPADTGVKATTAPAEFRAIKSYIAGLISGAVDFLGDLQLKNAAYLKSKLAAGGTTRLLGINALNEIYLGSVDAATGSSIHIINGVDQIVIDHFGNVGINNSAPGSLGKFVVGDTNGTLFWTAPTPGFGELCMAGGPGNFMRIGPANYANGGVMLMYTTGSGVRTAGAQLDSAGNVSIGSTPVALFGGAIDKLQVITAAAPASLAVFQGDGTYNLRMQMFANSANFTVGFDVGYSSNYAGIVFKSNGIERMRCDAVGNLGIGRVPTVKLDVAGALALAAPLYLAGTTYTVGVGDSCLRIAANCTLLLPAAASFTGRILRVLNVGAFTVTSTANNVVQQLTGTTGTAILPATAGSWADLQSDGVYWVITASR